MGRADFDERSRVASLPGKNFFTTKTPRKDKADFEQEETEVTENSILTFPKNGGRGKRTN
jgi:hypothetical protein